MGNGASSRHIKSVLTESSFQRLLASLDPDRDRAGERYELVRRKLVKFFECRASATSEDDADETISRVARRIEEGEAIGNLSAYFYGVARLVLLEGGRERRRESVAATALSEAREVEAGNSEERLHCLERCLDTLPAPSRELIVTYYRGEGSYRIRQRHQLAVELGIPLNALRIRVHRLRARLEECVKGCLPPS